MGFFFEVEAMFATVLNSLVVLMWTTQRNFLVAMDMFSFLVNNMNHETKMFTCINKANNYNKISISNQKHSHFFHITSVATTNWYNVKNKE